MNAPRPLFASVRLRRVHAMPTGRLDRRTLCGIAVTDEAAEAARGRAADADRVVGSLSCLACANRLGRMVAA